MMMICTIFESLTAVVLKIQAFWDVTLVEWCMVTDVAKELPEFIFRVKHSVDC
jgi:hypothetical protein